MVEDVLDELARAELGPLVVVSGEPRALARAADAGASTVVDEREDGQSAAALLGLARARELGCERALLVPGDCPLIDGRELTRADRPRGVARRRDRARPPRHRDECAGARGRRRVRAAVRARVVRTPRRAGDRRTDSSTRWSGAVAGAGRRHRRGRVRAGGRPRAASRPRAAHARGARPRRGMTLRIVAEPVAGLPEVEPGDDLAALIVATGAGDRERRRRGREPEGRLQGRGTARAALGREALTRGAPARGRARQGAGDGAAGARREQRGPARGARRADHTHASRPRVRERRSRPLERAWRRSRVPAARGSRRLRARAARRAAGSGPRS